MPSRCRTLAYLGYGIERGPDGCYRVTPPEGGRWPGAAVNLETAKRWILQHRAERLARVYRANRAQAAQGATHAE